MASYLFQIDCIEPVSLSSRQCANQRWVVQAQGQFVATANDVRITPTVRLNTKPCALLTITVLNIGVEAGPGVRSRRERPRLTGVKSRLSNPRTPLETSAALVA